MADVFPQRNLPGRSEEWGRKVEDRIVAGESSETQLSQKVDNGLRATGGQLAIIADQLDRIEVASSMLAEQIERLNNAGQIVEEEDGSSFAGAGWRPGRPSVTSTSLSGRFLVSIFGTAAGATSFFTYSAPGKPRSRAEGSSTTANLERISAAGGASNTSTAYGAWIYETSPGSAVEFIGEGLGTTEFSASAAVKIRVQPLL